MIKESSELWNLFFTEFHTQFYIKDDLILFEIQTVPAFSSFASMGILPGLLEFNIGEAFEID